MAMHVVLGDGEMSKKELTETLKDLWEQAGDEAFWFVIQGKSASHRNRHQPRQVVDDQRGLLRSPHRRRRCDGRDLRRRPRRRTSSSDSDRRSSTCSTPSQRKDEEADVLALFVSDDPAAEEDRWLNNVLQAAVGCRVQGLRSQRRPDRARSRCRDDDAEPEPEEEEEVPTKPTKRAAKKASAAAAPAKAKTYTRDELEEMELDQLKVIAGEKGIELPPVLGTPRTSTRSWARTTRTHRPSRSPLLR